MAKQSMLGVQLKEVRDFSGLAFEPCRVAAHCMYTVMLMTGVAERREHARG